MINWEISSPLVGTLWLVAGGGLAYWFRGRRLAGLRLLRGEDGSNPTPDEAAAIRARLVREAFLTGGAWLLLYLVLAALF